jgi:hypothetical protein
MLKRFTTKSVGASHEPDALTELCTAVRPVERDHLTDFESRALREVIFLAALPCQVSVRSQYIFCWLRDWSSVPEEGKAEQGQTDTGSRTRTIQCAGTTWPAMWALAFSCARATSNEVSMNGSEQPRAGLAPALALPSAFLFPCSSTSHRTLICRRSVAAEGHRPYWRPSSARQPRLTWDGT